MRNGASGARRGELEIMADAATGTAEPAGKRRSPRNLLLLLVAVVVLDILAFIVVPPFPKGEPAGECPYPACFISGNLELPAPHVVFDLDPNSSLGTGGLVVGFDPTITSPLLTMWIVEILLLIVFVAATRGLREIPRGVQNLVEWAYETLQNFAVSIGGADAVKHVPIYAAFFILILFSNWSGLVPPVGKMEELRAPTSDVNVTIGLALAAFAYFEFQGFRANGLGYLKKFFPVYEFKSGIGAGLIAMFVGLIELLLEFIKPVTLAMRLFGNIYGGEVALGVMTALVVAVVPVALYFLEAILTFAQALIFSVLTLMFTLIAVESHDHDEGEMGHEAMDAVHDSTQAAPAAA